MSQGAGMNHNPIRFQIQAAMQKRWTVRESRRRRVPYWEIINSHRDTVAVVYGGKADAELLASAPQQHAAAQELRACNDRLIAMLRRFEERLLPSERETLKRAHELASR